MAKALMIQGTGSGAGKSLLVTALCRIFNNRGIKVAPFKAQNMALNSYITKDGGEIGRAQALQAEAARIEPTVDMNPVLLKASGEKGCQVIVRGKVFGNYEAKRYYSLKESLWPYVKESFDKLMEEYELVVMEGAGSPAEINLMDSDIVNMRMAEYARAPVLLVGDIDRGGVFASLYGTVKLLGRQSRFVKAFIINKFRGDMEILKPGLQMIKDKTGRPVIGVVPYINTGLPEEDGLVLQHRPPSAFSLKSHLQPSALSLKPLIKIVVVRLQYISNFTDFDPLLYEPDVEVLYSRNPSDIENADIVILPGTKNTVKDLLFLKEEGLEASIKRAYEKGIMIIGICGGYQMLGKRLYDPDCVESNYKELEGIGLLNIETVFETTKITAQVEAELNTSAFFSHSTVRPSLLKGYEIHMGRSDGDISLFKISRITDYASRITGLLDGSMNGNCWGTYIHGVFENDQFRRAVINSARIKKGLEPLPFTYSYRDLKEQMIDSLSMIIEKHIDMPFIWRLIS